jgi:hypothetical protein
MLGKSRARARHAATVAYLASDDASFVTDAELDVADRFVPR